MAPRKSRGDAAGAPKKVRAAAKVRKKKSLAIGRGRTRRHAEAPPAPASQSFPNPTAGDVGKVAAAETADGADDRVKRAEEMVGRIGQSVDAYATWVGHQLFRVAARAREGIGGIVAEAQGIRQQNSP